MTSRRDRSLEYAGMMVLRLGERSQFWGIFQVNLPRWVWLNRHNLDHLDNYLRSWCHWTKYHPLKWPQGNSYFQIGEWFSNSARCIPDIFSPSFSHHFPIFSVLNLARNRSSFLWGLRVARSVRTVKKLSGRNAAPAMVWFWTLGTSEDWTTFA